jgi:ABC-type nitrate/sulfonate/bicarbonate transport system ATPase subunit
MHDHNALLSRKQPPTDLFVTANMNAAIFFAGRLFAMSHIPTRVRAVTHRATSLRSSRTIAPTP